DAVPIGFQPALEPLLEPTVQLLDLLGHEGPSIRKCQNTDGGHGPCSFPQERRLCPFTETRTARIMPARARGSVSNRERSAWELARSPGEASNIRRLTPAVLSA